ncbi:DTW domain-containing protein [Colwellia sp. D2M02]|uniref:tRNA-uridine aminocarboxypropyltransferase n=1 Tax=Colwellia sp. D2M02 TaxID=2841562 RepID=UPI001C08956F|nr:tRNA-uridine aminocarboxypropyltransferase [Colwellia sp. D2M02]MBU2892995.1 DTW domain-containing protein [Colwellia sp. D2M02]
MTRILCSQCQRPPIACICAFISAVDNTIDVVVLQHPNEVTHSKGTVALLSKSLQSCQVIVGEDFTDNEHFQKVLVNYQPLLLYPSEQAQILGQAPLNSPSHVSLSNKPYCLVILDGTWKKAYRMLMLCEQLQQLPQVCLPDHLAQAGQYHIRKVAKHNALSSLEACCYALALLEKPNDSTHSITPDNTGKYQPIINNFLAFNKFQLSFRPTDT